MRKFEVIYSIEMKNGLLSGMVIPNRKLDYPMSRLEHVKWDFENDVKTKKVYKDCSSNSYVILDFEIRYN